MRKYKRGDKITSVADKGEMKKCQTNRIVLIAD